MTTSPVASCARAGTTDHPRRIGCAQNLRGVLGTLKRVLTIEAIQQQFSVLLISNLPLRVQQVLAHRFARSIQNAANRTCEAAVLLIGQYGDVRSHSIFFTGQANAVEFFRSTSKRINDESPNTGVLRTIAGRNLVQQKRGDIDFEHHFNICVCGFQTHTQADAFGAFCNAASAE